MWDGSSITNVHRAIVATSVPTTMMRFPDKSKAPLLQSRQTCDRMVMKVITSEAEKIFTQGINVLGSCRPISQL
jgi:hypothetical protein